MKEVQLTTSELKQFAAQMYAEDKTPSERFGMTWEELSTLEKENPELTCKQSREAHRAA